MSLDEIIVALRDRKLELNCSEIVLTQAVASNPISYRGKGQISQTEDDGLMFKIEAAEATNIDAFAHLRMGMSSESGRLFGDADYYDLSATDQDGRVWKAERILPQCKWTLQPPNPIVTVDGSFDTAATKAEASDVRNSVQLFFFDEVELPYSYQSLVAKDGTSTVVGDKAAFAAVNCSFLFSRRDHGFTVDVQSGASINVDMATRIAEALQFLVARRVLCRVQVRQDGQDRLVEITAGRQAATKSNFPPPILPTDISIFVDGWKLFSKYLEYILKTPHSYWNVCSYHLDNAREAGGGSVDSWAVGVSVATEALASLVRLDDDPAEKDLLKKLRDSVLAHIAADPELAGQAKRLSGLLDMMGSKPPMDRLAPLVTTGHVDQSNIKAWKSLRNKYVHPKVTHFESATRGDKLQKMLDLLYGATVLMYQITFFLIGYEGRYANYAAPGWPSTDYPKRTADVPAAPS